MLDNIVVVSFKIVCRENGRYFFGGLSPFFLNNHYLVSHFNNRNARSHKKIETHYQ